MTTHRRLARSGEIGWLEAHAWRAAVSSAFHSFQIVPERSGGAEDVLTVHREHNSNNSSAVVNVVDQR
jgi:hypothetical protein